MPVTASGERTPILIFPPPGITRVSLNREHYYANPNPLAVSASKSRGTVSGIRGPHGDFRGRLPAITAPPDWVASFFSLMSGERTGIRPNSRCCKSFFKSFACQRARGVSLATQTSIPKVEPKVNNFFQEKFPRLRFQESTVIRDTVSAPSPRGFSYFGISSNFALLWGAPLRGRGVLNEMVDSLGVEPSPNEGPLSALIVGKPFRTRKSHFYRRTICTSRCDRLSLAFVEDFGRLASALCRLLFTLLIAMVEAGGIEPPSALP